MIKPRNEILEVGQEVVLYHDTTWMGDIRCTGVLIKKAVDESSCEEEWEILASDGEYNHWWFGRPHTFRKDKSNDTEK